ncbi:hypothetical protein [Anaerosoma tenue]|uniref:hypothetical protein n=1 Tax=Anaerosoma tenue TaxID=2933588 RepID=UPI002260FA3C|nr:hypothetical protein [Anaerosoma tenue]MCK8115818.1 hypothetical protein [Anaerosoma tenue]
MSISRFGPSRNTRPSFSITTRSTSGTMSLTWWVTITSAVVSAIRLRSRRKW